MSRRQCGSFFDQGTPAPLRRALAGHSVSTAYEEGWNTLTNGELLAAAERSFDVFVTTDHNLRYQQNLTGRRLAILVLPTTSWPRLQPHAGAIAMPWRPCAPASCGNGPSPAEGLHPQLGCSESGLPTPQAHATIWWTPTVARH